MNKNLAMVIYTVGITSLALVGNIGCAVIGTILVMIAIYDGRNS